MTVIMARRSGFSIWPIAIAFNALLLAVCVFIVTQEVKRHEAGVQDLNRKILAEQQTLRVLDAEWAYLTRPQRLEDLLAMKANGGVMPAEPDVAESTMETPAETPKKTASIEPAAGVASVAAKPKDVQVAVKPATVQKIAVKAEPKKPLVKKAPKAPEKDIVWSIKRPAASPRQAQVAAYPARAGVAKPILE